MNNIQKFSIFARFHFISLSKLFVSLTVQCKQLELPLIYQKILLEDRLSITDFKKPQNTDELQTQDILIIHWLFY